MSASNHRLPCLPALNPSRFLPSSSPPAGDHLAWSHRLQRMTIFRDYNWHSVPLQLESVAKLRGVEFLHCLPGHGRRASFADLGDMRRQLDALLSAEGYSG